MQPMLQEIRKNNLRSKRYLTGCRPAQTRLAVDERSSGSALTPPHGRRCGCPLELCSAGRSASAALSRMRAARMERPQPLGGFSRFGTSPCTGVRRAARHNISGMASGNASRV